MWWLGCPPHTRYSVMTANILNDLQAQPISREVLLEKYAKGEEHSIEAVQARVAAALAQAEAPEARASWAAAFIILCLGSSMFTSEFRPRGRVGEPFVVFFGEFAKKLGGTKGG